MPRCISSNEQIKSFKIVGGFNCKQAEFLSTSLLQTGRARRSQNSEIFGEIIDIFITPTVFFNRFYFGKRFGYVKKALNFYYFSDNYSLGEVAASLLI